MAETAGDDSQLVKRAVAQAKQGDPAGLHLLYARYAPDVRRSVAGFVRHERKAKDITQDVFAELGAAIDKYEGSEPFAVWMLRIARSAASAHTRRRRVLWGVPRRWFG